MDSDRVVDAEDVRMKRLKHLGQISSASILVSSIHPALGTAASLSASTVHTGLDLAQSADLAGPSSAPACPAEEELVLHITDELWIIPNPSEVSRSAASWTVPDASSTLRESPSKALDAAAAPLSTCAFSVKPEPMPQAASVLFLTRAQSEDLLKSVQLIISPFVGAEAPTNNVRAQATQSAASSSCKPQEELEEADGGMHSGFYKRRKHTHLQNQLQRMHLSPSLSKGLGKENVSPTAPKRKPGRPKGSRNKKSSVLESSVKDVWGNVSVSEVPTGRVRAPQSTASSPRKPFQELSLSQEMEEVKGGMLHSIMVHGSDSSSDEDDLNRSKKLAAFRGQQRALQKNSNWREQLPSTFCKGFGRKNSPAPAPKRKPGRPKGSKNKPKVAERVVKGSKYQCNICHEGRESGVLTITECGHIFHIVCLNRWISTSNQKYRSKKVCGFCGVHYEETFPFNL